MASSIRRHNGARMPAEWEPHEACLLLLPHNPCVFRSNSRPARQQVLQVARTIATSGKEDVIIFCNTKEDVNEIRTQLLHRADEQDGGDDDGRISLAVCPSDDSWARDTGPTFVQTTRNGSTRNLCGLDWNFNAYGGERDGCYWPCDLDQNVASHMSSFLSRHHSIPIPTHKVPLVLEGGSIHTDGQGTVLTTAECLLNPNRNPQLSREQIESLVLGALGCSRMIWLPLGLAADDDTNGHIDNMACFSEPGHVLLSWTDDQNVDAENYDRCRQAMKVLESQADAQGRTLTVHKLYLPPPLFYTEDEVATLVPPADDSVSAARVAGDRLAASYVNFYIANEAVIVPQFGVEPWDSKAVETLQEIFPSRLVKGVASREILLGGGNIHCITQQMPRLS